MSNVINYKGGFKIGGVHYQHPLSVEQIEFLLKLLGEKDFKGEEVQVHFEIAYQLQEEYNLMVERGEKQHIFKKD